jgi:hypothetical protein
MTEPIELSEFMQVNGLDPGAGLAGPMTARGATSLVAFIGMLTPVWDPTIKTLFQPDDRTHMLYGSPEGIPADLFDLADVNDVRARARNILRVVRSEDPLIRMPKPPTPDDRDQTDKRWGPDLVDLFHQWVAGGMPG